MPIPKTSISPARSALCAILILGGLAAFTLTPPDGWTGLIGLSAFLFGIAGLFGLMRQWRNLYGKRRATALLNVRLKWIRILMRVAAVIIMAIGAIAWIWSAAIDLREVCLLAADPHYARAQITGRELVKRRAPIGYVHYAYRVTSTLAPEDRFAVAFSDYPKYRVGMAFEITYAGAEPRIHRLGHIVWEYAIRRALYWLLLLCTGVAAGFFSLWLLTTARPATEN